MHVGCVALAGLLPAGALAQETKKPASKPHAAQAVMLAPQPGPEHAILEKEVGTWDAAVEMMPPGAPPSTAKGTEHNRLMGGRWLIRDLTIQIMDQPFEGHATTGWDPQKKKYVESWIDSMGTTQYIGESAYDAATKTATGWMEGPDETGKPNRIVKTITEYKDDDTRVFKMFTKGPDGKETQTMKITYTRRK